jgi:epoxyqueuosine reductase
MRQNLNSVFFRILFMPSQEEILSVLIKEKVLELGFDICGIARVRTLSERGVVLKSWCDAGMNSDMSYLNRDIEKRLNPDLLFPGARSLVVTGLSYYSENMQKDKNAPVLSRYAYGVNYHDVIGTKLKKLFTFVKTISSDCKGKIYVDSGPLLEKAWAQEAGLGWQGRHSILINKEIGSFFFIGSLILNIELDYDEPFTKELCGDCRICIDSCPTDAINNDRTIDARKCIANLTIENRSPIPSEIIPRLEGRVYGCDKCQEVCPWNKNAQTHTHPEFNILGEVADMRRDEWITLSRDRFGRLFKNTAIGRLKYENFMRNISAAIVSLNQQ